MSDGTPFIDACKAGQLDVLKPMIEADPSIVNSRSDDQMPAIISRISRSEAPALSERLRSSPLVANRQVTRWPSGVRRALVQSAQKGWLTDAIIPISPLPSTYS